jgi:Ca2+-binding RTX toxin-like protein
VVFEPSGSQFGGGAAPEPFQRFFGIGQPTPVGGPFSLGGAVSAKLPFIGEVELFRARLFGELRAVFGLDISAAFDPGSIDAVLPYNVALAFPDLDPVADDGEIIAIHFAGRPDFDAQSGFTTSFPSLRFQIDLVAALDVLLAAELGVAGNNRTFVLADFSPNTRIPLISVDTARQTGDGAADPVNLFGVTTQELVDMAGLDPAYNANGDFAGISVPLNTFVSKPEAKEKPKAEVEKEGDKVPKEDEDEEEEPDLSGIDLGSIAILVPSINTVSKYVDGVFVTDPTRKLLNGEIVPDLDENGVNIGEGNKDDLVVLTLDVDGLITFATGGAFPPLEFGLPPLKGSLGPMNFEASFYYNLLDVELEAALPLVQEFTLTPALRTRLSFFEVNDQGGKGAQKFVDAIQVERQLLFDPTGVFQDPDVEKTLRELAKNPTYARDIELFVDFKDGIPGSFTGETGSVGGRMVWSQDGGTNWQNLETDTVLARSAPMLGQDQAVELDLSGIEVGYRIIIGSGPGEIIPVAFDPTDSVYRQQVTEIVAPLQQTPFLPDIGALSLRYDGATTYVEVETQAFPLATNRTGLEFDLSLLLSGLAASAEFDASVDVGPFTLGAGFDIDLGPLFQESFPLLNLDIVDLYNETFRIQDSHIASFVLGAEPPPTDYGDAIVGTPGADSLEGADGNDQIVGLGGDDVLRGLGGADTIQPGEGGATVEGGAGVDVLDFSDIDARVLLYPYLPGMQSGARFGVTLGGGWVERPDAAGPTAALIFYDGIERVRLTDAPDFVDLPYYWLTPPPPVIETLGDDDWADVELPNVMLRMGEGDDRVTFRPAGLEQGETPIEIDGGPGTDTLTIQDSPNAADPVLVADLGLGTLSDSSGSVALVSGFETLRAQVTTPIRLVGDAERNVLDGSNVFLGGGGFNDEPIATGGATLDGQAGNDTLWGSGHNDLLIGGPGADSMSGGAGADTVSYADAPTSVFIDLDVGGTGRGYRGEAQGDVLVGIEHVLGTAFNDILIGSDGSETLEGGEGDDRLAAQNGFDLLLGGAGNDLLARGLLADREAANIAGFNVFDGGDNFDVVAFSVNDVALSGDVGGRARYRTVESRFLASDRIGTEDRNVTFTYAVTDARFLSARLGEGEADGTAQIIAPELRSKIILTSIEGSARFNYTHTGFAGFETGWNAGYAPISEIYAGFTRAAIIGLDIPLPLGRVGGALGRTETQNEYLNKHNGSDNIVKSSYAGSVLSVNTATALRSTDTVASTDILRNVEGIIGTHNNDRIFGNSQDNALFGNGGDDYIEGGAGDDRLGFGEGQRLTLDFSFPQAPGFGRRGGGFLGPTGVQPLLNQLRTLDPDAAVTSASPRVNVGEVKVGTSNGITDFGSFLWGGAGSDTLDLRFDRGIGFYPSAPPTARALVDLDAAPTNTTISTVTGQRVVYGEAKWLNFRAETIEKATLFGIENVIGSAQADTILGDARDNVIEGMAGADSMDGRGGSDTLSYALAPEGVGLSLRVDAGRIVVDNTAAGREGSGHARGDVARNFEVFVGSAHADTVLLDLLLPTVIAEPMIPVPLQVIQLGGDGQVATWTFDYPARFAQAAVPPATVFGNFDLGDGDDVVTLLGIAQGNIDLGAGDDMLSIAGMGLTILLGVGDDMVTVLDTPAGSYEFLPAEFRTTTIIGADGDDLDTVVFEGDGLLQLILTPQGARVLRLGDLMFSPESVTPQDILDNSGFGAFFTLEQDNTPIALGELWPMREVIEGAMSAPAIFDLVGIEQVVIGGEAIRLDSVDPVVQADRALTIAEDAREPFGLNARAPAAEASAGALYRVVALPETAQLLRPDATPLALGDSFAAGDLAALKVLAGQNYGAVAETFVFALDGAPEGTPHRIVALPPEPKVPGIALGITAPFDPLGNAVTVEVTEMPTAGTVFFLTPDPVLLALGMMVPVEQAIALGDLLTPEQLAALHFRAPENGSGDLGGFAYVADTGLGFRELAATTMAETADAGVDVALRDGRGGQRIAIDATPVNDAPDVATLLYPLSPGGTLDGQLLATDAEQDEFTFSLVRVPTFGTLHVLADGSFTYVQDAALDFDGKAFLEDSFVVRATETGTGIASADALQILRIVNPAMQMVIAFDASRRDVFFDAAGDPIALGGLGTDDEIIGHAGPDQLFGFGGNDLLHGRHGDDTLDGGTGSDTAFGGAGDDAYVVDDPTDRILETRPGGADTVHASTTWALVAHLEDLVLTGDAAIDGTGNSLNNVITGNDAANVLIGGGRADTLIGGGGDDLYLIDATDLLVEQASGGHDVVVANATFALPDHIEELRFNGSANVRGDGNAEDNQIRGNAAHNRLLGHEGDDSLNGGLGDDILFGGNGADSLVGSGGADTLVGGADDDVYLVDSLDRVVEAANEGTDTILTAMSYTLPMHVENLTLLGSDGLTGTGNAHDNVLLGNSGANLLRGLGGADRLSGGQGADTLEGGLGADTLTGSGGADRFLWRAPAEGGDTLVDFRPGDDTLAFLAVGFGGLAVVTLSQDVAAGGVAQFVYTGASGVLEWDADGTGAGAAAIIATLSNRPTLAATDFVIV